MTQINVIDAPDFTALIQENKDVQILDIRSNLEYDTLALDYDVTHIALHEIDIENRARSDKNTYILCKMGPRAYKLAEVLAQNGHENLVVIDGGIIGCVQAGAPIKSSENQPAQEEIMAAVQNSFQQFMMKNG